jgi:ABC-2 type transport system ATP-binding protein
MIAVKNFSKIYEGTNAVNNITFNANKGEVLAIIGPNGAGKSTTLKSIIGLLKPTHGNITISGMKHENDSIKIKKIIGFMPEENSIYEDMTTFDYLIFYASLYGIKKEVAKQRINYLLNSLVLEKDKIIGNMSKGMKRKTLIARSLINNPKILIYDEPASGLDPSTTKFILDYIKNLKDSGKTIIITAHNLRHIEIVADKVIILQKGKIIINDNLEKIRLKFGKTHTIRYKKDNLIKEKSFIDEKEMNRFLKELVKLNLEVVDAHSEYKSLEDIYLNLTSK